jgi:hypothetical protein
MRVAGKGPDGRKGRGSVKSRMVKLKSCRFVLEVLPSLSWEQRSQNRRELGDDDQEVRWWSGRCEDRRYDASARSSQGR